MGRTWNLDGLREHAKAKSETVRRAERLSKTTISEADAEPCAICKRTKWLHKQPQSWRADDGHEFVGSSKEEMVK